MGNSSQPSRRIIRRMQLLYQARDSKFDFAAKRAKRLAELRGFAAQNGIYIEEDPEGATILSSYDGTRLWHSFLMCTLMKGSRCCTKLRTPLGYS